MTGDGDDHHTERGLLIATELVYVRGIVAKARALACHNQRSLFRITVPNTIHGMNASVSESSRPRERSLNVPNAITFSRLMLSFVLFGLIQWGGAWIWTAGLFVFAVATDVLDGYIARRYKLITQLGRILDPFVDKFITSGTFVFLLPRPESGVTPWIVVIVLGREMLVTSLRGFLETQGADFSASASGKLKMFLQSVAATVSLLSLDPGCAAWSISGINLPQIRDVLLWSMVAVTVWSGVVYVRRAIQLLRVVD